MTFSEVLSLRDNSRLDSHCLFIETGAAAQHIIICAVALGFGSVFVGGIDDDKTRTVSGIKNSIDPLLPICIGHPR